MSDREKEDYWTGADVRTRVTFRAKNLFVNLGNYMAKKMAAGIATSKNAKKLRKTLNFSGRQTGR